MLRWPFIFALVASPSIGFAAPPASAPLRIMCLGDSITAGYTDNPHWKEPFRFGYRSGLYTRLRKAGYDFQFVGQSAEPDQKAYGSPPRPLDPDLRALDQHQHRGYGGWGTKLILGGIGKWIDVDQPDLVLLMIGINDNYAASTSRTAQETLERIVDVIFTKRPQTKVIVAQITPTLKPAPQILDYNRHIRETLVPAYRARGMKIITVDQYRTFLDDKGSVDPTRFSNGINHPTNATYDMIAQTWFEGIESLVTPPAGPPAAEAPAARK